MKNNLDGKWGQFVNPAKKDEYTSTLTATEDWLYEDGEDVTKSVYDSKYEELNKIGQPIAQRYLEFEKRPDAIEGLRYAIVKYRKAFDQFTAKDEKYDHLDADDMAKVDAAVLEADAWINELEAKQNATPLYEDAVIVASIVDARTSALKSTCEPIVTKPKPVVIPEVPHPDGGAPDIPHPDVTPATSDEKPATSDEKPAEEPAADQAGMEVD